MQKACQKLLILMLFAGKTSSKLPKPTGALKKYLAELQQGQTG